MNGTWVLLIMLLAPFLAALGGLSGKCREHRLYPKVTCGLIGVSFLCALILLSLVLRTSPEQPLMAQFAWMSFGLSSIPMGFLIDPLAVLMLLIVSFVSLMVFIFSTGYMADDPRQGRYFCFLSLFTGAMLGTVVANSLLTLLLFWEIMGLASYLLIGFWYQKPEAAAAAQKAFLTTRIGDVGLLAAVFWLYNQTGTVLFYDGGAGLLEPQQIAQLGVAGVWAGAGYLFWITLLVFWGAMGKSGQIPLHVWLPDAMEGPTPVSALIHAATMVAAGVFLMCRIYPLYESSATMLSLIGWIGGITALFAALVAVAQSDIKRILAYSTISQLGLMFLGLSVGGPVVAMFHLFTHAFFKSLLFLGSGSVIHACAGEQNIFRMGGLKKIMPVTFLTYVTGYLALAAFPLFSGFWSKDEILYRLYQAQTPLLIFAILVSFLTAFYMTRQVALIFLGDFRGEHTLKKHLHESPRVLTVPLMILAVLAATAGYVGTPWANFFGAFMGAPEHEIHLSSHLGMMLVGSLLALGGIFYGYHLYGKKAPLSLEADPLRQWLKGGFDLLTQGLRIDEFYAVTLGRFMKACSRLGDAFDLILEFSNRALGGFVFGLSWLENRVLDKGLIDGGFDAGCRSVRIKGILASKLQSGFLSLYLRVMVLGLLIIGIIYHLME